MAAKEKVVLDFDLILEEEETKCSDDPWNYMEAPEDKLEDLEDYAKRRGFKPQCSSDKH